MESSLLSLIRASSDEESHDRTEKIAEKDRVSSRLRGEDSDEAGTDAKTKGGAQRSKVLVLL